MQPGVPRPWFRLAVTILALLLPGPIRAQQPEAGAAAARGTSVPAYPVRYDTDALSPEFHRGRRAEVLGELADGAVGVVLSAPERQRSKDVDYEYRQSSYLYYLTGLTEPGSMLVLAPGGIDVDGVRVREVLFVPARSPMGEMWSGRKFGTDGAMRELGMELAVESSRMREILEPVLREHSIFVAGWPAGVVGSSSLGTQVAFLREFAPAFEWPEGPAGYVQRAMLGVTSESAYERTRHRLQRTGGTRLFEDTEAAEMVQAFLDAGSAEAWLTWRDENLPDYVDETRLPAVIDRMREVKTPEELTFLRRAIDITAAAHREALGAIRPGRYEYEVEAAIEFVFKREGAEATGFPSIVGSGENSVILHYQTNRRRMQAGDLVVMDIGAEYRGYSADVTRTAPVSGEFSAEQKAIYRVVLRAQEAAIAAATVGATFEDLNAAATAEIGSGLAELGLLAGEEQLGRFLPHGVSHYLGLDVHDVGTYGPLPPGAVITVEPGIYIAPAPDVEERWWNIGIRIEDDVLVSESGPIVLSAGAPKAVEEIESIMRASRPGKASADR